MQGKYIRFFIATTRKMKIWGRNMGKYDEAELRLGLVAPDDAFAHALAIRFVRVERGAAHALEVFEGEAELGQHLLVRNALATVEEVASSSDLTGIVLRHRFIVQGSVGEAAGDGIEDSFEQADDGGKLCRGKPVNQFVGVLFGVGHESSSPLILTQRGRVANKIVGIAVLRETGGQRMGAVQKD